jgi:hypothetical protein
MIGVATPPLLLADFSSAAKNGVPAVYSEEQLDFIREKARSHFENRTEFLKRISAQKQETLEELVTFASFECIRANPSHNEVIIFVALDKEKTKIGLAFKLDRQANTLTDERELLDDFEVIQNACDGPSCFIVVKNSEIESFFVEAVWVAENAVPKIMRTAPTATPQEAPQP